MSQDVSLDDLLSCATEDIKETEHTLRECPLNFQGDTATEAQTKAKSSTLHSGETDSSDDEDRRDFENCKYNESGRTIKHLLKASEPLNVPSDESSFNTTWKSISNLKATASQAQHKSFKAEIRSAPFLGLRISNPLISSTTLDERMTNRSFISLSTIKLFTRNVPAGKDWVVAGVIVNKSPPKTSQKGKNYIIWTLSDLKVDLQTVSVFLFGSSYRELWKTGVGTAVGILNPSVMDLREGSKDQACLSVDNHQKVMLLGQSKDFGICKSMKKNGERCTAFVNLGVCEFCLYHIKQEYQKCSQRSELGSVGGGLVALRNKVLGKDQVFYGGKLYKAIPAKKSRKQTAMDNERLKALAGLKKNASKNTCTSKKKLAAMLDMEAGQKKKDLERLKKLGIGFGLGFEQRSMKFDDGKLSEGVSASVSKSLALEIIEKLQNRKVEVGCLSGNGLKNDESGRASEEKAGNSNQLETASKPANLSKLPETSSKPYDEFVEFSINLPGTCSKSPDAFNQPGASDTFNKTVCKPPETFLGFPSTCNKAQLQVSKNSSCQKENSQSKAPLSNVPTLIGSEKTQIDLNSPISYKKAWKAKQNALAWVQNHGPIEKEDPNSIRNKKKRKLLHDDPVDAVPVEKKSKIEQNQFFSERFKKMMAVTSKHVDLLETRDREEEEKYFSKLEMKERLEEKMLNTYKVPCKAVKCLKCKYTSFSAAVRCKVEKRPLKVYDAMKRFFKCGQCGNRTVSLQIIPMETCKNCGSGKWEKTSMMKPKKADIVKPNLSIRGDEQTFINSSISVTNLDLLVPK